MSEGNLLLNLKILIAPSAELSTQFLRVNLLLDRTRPSNVSSVSSATFFSAADSPRAFHVTSHFSGLSENFDVIWLNKDDCELPDTGDGSVDTFVPSEKNFVRQFVGKCL